MLKERRRVKNTILRKNGASKKEAELMLDGLFDLAIQLDKIARRHPPRNI